ncbi:MAG: TSUP family transporter [Acidiferrobacteraceae bacterium]
MPTVILLTAVAALTYSFEIVFGLGGTILMLPVLRFLLSTKVLVVYSAMPQILVGSIGLIRSPKTVDLRFLGWMLFYAVAGGIAGTVLFYHTSPVLFRKLLATMVTLVGVLLVVAPGHVRIGRKAARVFDTLAGASQALFGISGPIAMTRLLGTFEDKTVVRNYALAFFLALNILRLTGYAAYGVLGAGTVRLMAFSAPLLIIVLWRANQLHLRVSEKRFRHVIAWVIMAGGLSLFIGR